MTMCEVSMQASDGRNASIECGMSGRALARVIARFRAHGGERQVRWFAHGDVTYTGLGELLDALKVKAMWAVMYGDY